MVTYPRRLAIEASRFDLRVHCETTRAWPDLPMLQHGEYLLEQNCRFRLSRVHSPEDHVCRYECADLQSHLAVMMISTVRLWIPPAYPPTYLPSSTDATDLRI